MGRLGLEVVSIVSMASSLSMLPSYEKDFALIPTLAPAISGGGKTKNRRKEPKVKVNPFVRLSLGAKIKEPETKQDYIFYQGMVQARR
jgi:hypothetical protein